MSRSARLQALGLLFVIVAAVEVRLTWSTIVFAAWPETVYYRLPVGDSMVVGMKEFGGAGDSTIRVPVFPPHCIRDRSGRG